MINTRTKGSSMVKTFPHFLDEDVEVWEGGGTVHVMSYSLCSTARTLGYEYARYGRSPFPSGARVVRVKLREALKGCPECLKEARSNALDSVKGWAAGLELLEAATRAKSIRKVGKSTSAAAIAKRREEVNYCIGTAERAVSQASPETRELAQSILDQFLLAKDELDALRADPATIEKVKAKVKELMVPKRFVGTIELDETPHLVGISKLPHRPKSQVTAAIDAFAIRNDASGIVLLAPAYVYAFLLQQLFSKPADRTLVVGYPAPSDEAVCEVAAGIWDPEGASSQACMKTSIEAAHALV
jgi:hypothetical protein